MDSQKKTIKLIAYLNELTQKDKLQWERQEPPDAVVIGHNNRVDYVYTTVFEERRLRIYEERYKSWYDEDRYTWDTRVILDFVDFEGKSEWIFPYAPVLWDLLESVKYKSAHVDDFISEVLSKHKLDE